MAMPAPPPSVAAAPPPARICFNACCKELIHDPPPTSQAQPPPPRRKGWRLRSGEIADLCDRCSYAYEQGRFCETFHGDATGWRNCELCGKRIHCGCIVSTPAYVLLDAGGIECFACARKSGLASSQMMASPMLMYTERREIPSRTYRPMSGAFTGQWRQGAHMWSITGAQSDLQQRLSFEFDRPSAMERLIPGGRHSIFGHDKKFEEVPDRIITSSLNNVSRDRYVNGTPAPESVSTLNAYRREEGNADAIPDSCHLVGENSISSARKVIVADPSASSSGINFQANPSSCGNSHLPSILKEEPSSLLSGLAASFSPTNAPKDLARFSPNQTSRQVAPSLPKQFYPHGMMDTELQSQVRNGKSRVDTRTRANLLPRYWPRITDQELQQISGDSSSLVTPLFEKMLSASDAGRIGRLVLPKKCAEAYFPPISQPEGLPLKVQDATGKEWVFQFRFWPNNNSRMYVLEGVTPCIQSMQLQAGDTVTFSRTEPEGKLIMGFRKATNTSSEQDTLTPKVGNGSSPLEAHNKGISADLTANLPVQPEAKKPGTEIGSIVNAPDHPICSKPGKSGFIQKDGSGVKSSQGLKRKGSTLGSKNKRLRIDNEDAMELKLTWEEAQQLLRPPPNNAPSIVVVEGHEFEEYEEAPILGKCTYFTKDQAGETYQWAQCEDCAKWRKLPVDALLPSKWTCSDNTWDLERSSCSSSQEMSLEQIADLVSPKAGSSKRGKIKVEADNSETTGGLDTLANLAILGEGEDVPMTQQTTRHPRHRPGCTCIVCIQPPSGKGPKHKQTCACNVCITVRRRFKTLMQRREKRQSEKEAEAARKQQIANQSQGSSLQADNNYLPAAPSVKGSQRAIINNNGSQNAVVDSCVAVPEGSEARRASPLKAPHQIDLNIQPEREEEPSPKYEAANTMSSFLMSQLSKRESRLAI